MRVGTIRGRPASKWTICFLRRGLMRILLCVVVLAAFAGFAVADVNVTGKWSGSCNVIGPDGQTKDSTAVLVLKQNGSEITGTVSQMRASSTKSPRARSRAIRSRSNRLTADSPSNSIWSWTGT